MRRWIIAVLGFPSYSYGPKYHWEVLTKSHIYRMLYIYNWTFIMTSNIQSGWWFGTFFIFPYIGLLIIPIDFHILQRGGPTTNQQLMFFFVLIIYDSYDKYGCFYGMSTLSHQNFTSDFSRRLGRLRWSFVLPWPQDERDLGRPQAEFGFNHLNGKWYRFTVYLMGFAGI